MTLASLRITVRIGVGFRSRKKMLRSIVEKLHRHFNVSVIEVDPSQHPSDSVIGVAALGNSRREVRDVLDRVADAVTSHPRIELIALERDEH